MKEGYKYYFKIFTIGSVSGLLTCGALCLTKLLTGVPRGHNPGVTRTALTTVTSGVMTTIVFTTAEALKISE